ncbi:antibiotic biosynthesis monooxygenase [Corallococcus sp. BB11-1]|uniref:antibiotic biosynthesis monooxygenase family protein n=1 Tax=Corallococcus sp. BB11-1 TaxID=2996783 RepID=UPI002271A037|nr:antibiotic biosynthesis monooxygenase [Corallococcus sp. BB11-1]MCY1035373.1 antibiotic biosynthesis monooxygenase [Corallococcus sp. BB11-1]
MIARIDIAESAEVTSLERAWVRASRELAAQPGFLSTRIHRVYRRMNATGYDLVSIARWNDLAAYHSAEATGATLPVEGVRGINLYGCVDQSDFISQPARDSNLVILNPYRIRRPQAADNARMWNATRRLMARREGFIGAELFQTFHPGEDTFYFVSRAEWETEAAFMTQFEGRDYQQIVSPFSGTFQICFSNVIEEITKKDTP